MKRTTLSWFILISSYFQYDSKSDKNKDRHIINLINDVIY
jgi:hypothetical protein